MDARQNWILDETKNSDALFHEKCIMAHCSRMECPAVISVFNDRLLIYPVIGSDITMPRDSFKVALDDSVIRSSKYYWWKKSTVALLDNKNSRKFIFGFDDPEKLAAFVEAATN